MGDRGTAGECNPVCSGLGERSRCACDILSFRHRFVAGDVIHDGPFLFKVARQFGVGYFSTEQADLEILDALE